MPRANRQHVSTAIAQLMPLIVSGVQLDLFRRGEVTQRQFLVLIALHARGRCTMSALAGRMRVSLPTASGLMDRLAQAGHVRRVTNPADRRHVVVELAPKGQAFVRQFQEAVRRRWDDVLRALDARELDTFHQVVVKLTAALRQAGS